jgi:putative SOS response-associated peptidase YedK
MTGCQSFLIQTVTICGSIREMHDVKAVSDMLKPYDARLMRSYPVSSRVNHVDNDDEGCSAPVEASPTQNRLFLS